jgi:hypothetical protein
VIVALDIILSVVSWFAVHLRTASLAMIFMLDDHWALIPVSNTCFAMFTPLF